MVLHQLDDHPDVVAVVLDGDDPHDVGGVLCVRVGAVFVGQHQARVSLMHLEHRNMQISKSLYQYQSSVPLLSPGPLHSSVTLGSILSWCVVSSAVPPAPNLAQLWDRKKVMSFH